MKINPESMHQIYSYAEKLFNMKNRDYGDAFEKSIDDFGLLGGFIRIHDKYQRAKTLLQKNEQLVKDESIYDTLVDMANYALMLATYISNKGVNDEPKLSSHAREWGCHADPDCTE